MSTVLVIDDDEDIRELWGEALSDYGFDVRLASSGVEGTTIVSSEIIHVVVTDILMPDQDGFETLKEIKAISGGAQVLAVSGGGSRGNLSYLDMAAKLGANATLQKPVSLTVLCEIVAVLCSRFGREVAAE